MRLETSKTQTLQTCGSEHSALSITGLHHRQMSLLTMAAGAAKVGAQMEVRGLRPCAALRLECANCTVQPVLPDEDSSRHSAHNGTENFTCQAVEEGEARGVAAAAAGMAAAEAEVAAGATWGPTFTRSCAS